ncbi:AMP-binding protein [Photobacterium lutimaris]|uniref:AMP-fatty acid ligase n=1 Tax=Photobacterium lutimaris TaxID=388278 RepID=A0A2T3J3A4_9GAMM|nr:AMP-binding protein [Photobacterium lutimaris]PSU35787.1 AMP-fatty acid ligase [Photobacterium lutimaris]TDR78857.1 acyl-coenzyme A synthetase/AMP-(fatty) acid ligase [Photobacterium lutimaris]
MNTQQIDGSNFLRPELCSLSKVMTSSRLQTLLVAGDSDIDWAQFQADVKALQRTLISSPLQRWALCFDDSYLFAVAFFALSHAGKDIVLPGNHQPSALEELVDHFEAILHDKLDSMPLEAHQLPLPLDKPDFHAADIEIKPLNLRNVTLTLFTSGSSGMPKAITKSLETIDAEICHLEQVWGDLLRGASVVSTVSHQHIYGLLFRVLWPLCAGRPFSRQDCRYPEQVMLAANPDTVLISSPALLKRLDAEPASASFRAIFSSGGPLSLDVAHRVETIFRQLPVEVFGSTETGGIGYRQQQTAETPWKRFDVIDIALNVDGCLRLRSPYIESEDWYHTSDLCQCLGENHFIVKGRSDRVVKVEEKRISLAEVERHLCHLEWVEEAVVLPLADTKRLVIATVITLNQEGQQKLAQLGRGPFWLAVRQGLRQWVEPVGIPRRFRVVDEIPQNSQGKHQVNELKQLFDE